MLFLLDERLHKGLEGTGPRQRGGAAECPQVSLSPVVTYQGSQPLRSIAHVHAVPTESEGRSARLTPCMFEHTGSCQPPVEVSTIVIISF